MSRLIAALALLVVAGCGTEGPNGPDQSTGGIYAGLITPSGATSPNSFSGLIDETGFGFFVDDVAGTIYGFQTVPDGRVLGADFVAYAPGFDAVPGVLSGTITERLGITGFATSERGNETFAVDYQAPRYEQPSSLLLIAGDYAVSSGVPGTLSIDSNGTVTASDVSGCTFTGVASIPDVRFNAYRVNGSSACPGQPTRMLAGIASYTPQVDATPPGLLLIYGDGVDFATVINAQRL